MEQRTARSVGAVIVVALLAAGIFWYLDAGSGCGRCRPFAGKAVRESASLGIVAWYQPCPPGDCNPSGADPDDVLGLNISVTHGDGTVLFFPVDQRAMGLGEPVVIPGILDTTPDNHVVAAVVYRGGNATVQHQVIVDTVL